MATGMHMDKRNVDCSVLGHHDQDRKVSAKSVTMRAMTLCKNLSGYRELLLILNVPSAIFQLNRGGSSWIEPVLSWDKCVLLKDHNTVTPVRLEPAAHSVSSQALYH